MKRLRGRWLVLATVTASLATSAVVVTGVRVAQARLSPDQFTSATVRVDLPRIKTAATHLVMGLHASPISAGTASMSARVGATGLVTATSADGTVVGETLLPEDPLLRAPPAEVTYQTTAETLVLQTPALVTSSPLLASLIMSEAARSPEVARLADVLRSEAARRGAYLSDPDTTLVGALAAAATDVSSRVRSDFPVPARPASSRGAGPTPGSDTIRLTAAVSGGPAPLPANPVLASDLLPDHIVLADTTGTSACSSHRVSDALCVEHTYPLALDSPQLAITDWSAGWQFLYRSDQLDPSAPGFQLPLAIVPPIVNAPPTIAGLITTALDTGRNYLTQEGACTVMQARLAGSCNQPGFVQQLGDEIFRQLTLAGASDPVYLPLTPELEKARLSAVGLGSMPGAGASSTENLAWGASLGLSALTEFILPAIQLVMDSRSLDKEHEAENLKGAADEAETTAKGARTRAEESQHSADVARGSADHLESVAKDKFATYEQARSAQVTADAASAQAAQAAAAEHVRLDQAKATLAQVQADYAAGTATLSDVRSAAGRVGGLQAQANKLDAAAASAAGTAKAADAAVAGPATAARVADDSAATAEQEAVTAEQQASADQRAARQAEQDATSAAKAANEAHHVATSSGLIANVVSAIFQVMHDHMADLAAAYDDMKAGQNQHALERLQPVFREIEAGAGPIAALLLRDATLMGEGFVVSGVLYEIPVVGEVAHGIDFGLNAVGLVQNINNLYHTIALPDRHDFPPIDENYRRGTPEGQLGRVFVGSFNRQDVLATIGQQGLTSLSSLSRDWFGGWTTPVCTDTVVMPPATGAGRQIFAANVSNLRDFHIAAGFAGTSGAAVLSYLDGAVPFTIWHSATPLGAGGAAFGDPPALGALVRVDHEGDPLHSRSFNARVTDVIGGQEVLAFEVAPLDQTTMSAGHQSVGGMVFATTGRNASQLIGLAEVEHGGQLLVLTGAGVANLTAGNPDCQEG